MSGDRVRGHMIVSVHLLGLLGQGHCVLIATGLGLDCRDGLAHWHHLDWLHILDTHL